EGREQSPANIVKGVAVRKQAQGIDVGKGVAIEYQQQEHGQAENGAKKEQERAAAAPARIDQRGIVQTDGEPEIWHTQRGQPDHAPPEVQRDKRRGRRERTGDKDGMDKKEEGGESQAYHAQA